MICSICGKDRPEHEMMVFNIGLGRKVCKCRRCDKRSTEDYIGRHMDIIGSPRYQARKEMK